MTNPERCAFLSQFSPRANSSVVAGDMVGDR